MKFLNKDFFRFLKIFLLSIFATTLFIYLAVYLLLPFLLNRNDYSQKLTEAVKKQTGLIIKIKNYKISVSPKLEITLKADNTAIFYPNKQQIININKAECSISTLNLLKKEIKINKIKADEFQFSTKLLKNGKTTLQTYLKKNIRPNKSSFVFSDKTPAVDIAKYIVKIKDEESGQKFKISGNNFKIAKNIDYRYLTLNTSGNLYCFNKKYIDYSLKLAVPKVLFKDVNTKLFDISFDNLYKQTFYANLNADLKIHTKDNKFDYLSGTANIDDFTMNIGKNSLPPSYFHIKTDKGSAFLTSKFYTDVNESSNIKANIKLKKTYEINLECVCPKADISNIQKLGISVLELLKIKNNLSDFNADGTISANFSVKTDLKYLESNGKLTVKNAKFTHKNIPLNFSKINALIDFSNNSIKIKNANLLVNNQPVNITGSVQPDATGDLKISADNLELKNIIKAFPMLSISKNISVISGKLSGSAVIKGRLIDAKPQIKIQINNLTAIETVNKIKISINNALINANVINKTAEGTAKLGKIVCQAKNLSNNTNSLYSDSVNIKFDQKNMAVLPSKFTTGNANMVFTGEIKNYTDSPEMVFKTGGNIDTNFIKEIIQPHMNNNTLYNKGYLPFKAEAKLKQNQAFVEASFLANPQNYITPLKIRSFESQNTLTHLLLKTDKENLIITEIATYYAPGVNSLTDSVNTFKMKKAILLKGKVKNYQENPLLDNIRFQTLSPLTVILPGIPNSTATANIDITANASIQKPSFSGILNIYDVNMPSYLTKVQNILITINHRNIIAQLKGIKLKNTAVNADFSASTDFLSTKKINNIKLDIGYINTEELLPFIESAKQSLYGPGIDFPYSILSGKLNIKTFRNGVLKAENITSNISSKPNILYLKNINADAYGGKAAGQISYNFPYSSINAQIQGRGMNAEAAAKDFMPEEQQISGQLNFDANVNMYGTTAQQQAKTLSGRADVVIKHGHLGQLGRFEHFLYAQNLLSQRLIYASLNSAKQAISPKDTGRFTYLKGMLKFKNGYVYLNPVITAGPQMSMYITGNLNPLTNDADLQILGKVSSEVSSSLGILGSMTIKDFLDEHTKYGQTIAGLFNFCNSELPEIDISKIPELNPDFKYQTKNFRVLITGDARSVKSVKSFTWVNPIGAKQKALTEKVKETIEKTLPPKNDELLTPTQDTAKPAAEFNTSKPSQSSSKPAGFLDNIPDNFKD